MTTAATHTAFGSVWYLHYTGKRFFLMCLIPQHDSYHAVLDNSFERLLFCLSPRTWAMPWQCCTSCRRAWTWTWSSQGCESSSTPQNASCLICWTSLSIMAGWLTPRWDGPHSSSLLFLFATDTTLLYCPPVRPGNISFRFTANDELLYNSFVSTLTCTNKT